MRDAAAGVLARHDVPARLRERDAVARELAAIEAEAAAVAREIPWWHRAAFFHDSPDELRASWLEDRRVAARRALDEAESALEGAFAAACAELPVLEVAMRVQRVIARTLGDPSIGLGAPGDGVILAELGSIADDVTARWVPGLDAAATLAALADDRRRADAARRDPGPPRADPRLGWAPIDAEELVARAASALATTAFSSLRSALEREASEHAALAARLRELRRAASPIAVMTGRHLDEHHAALAVEAALPREHAELVAAFEAFDHALLMAIGSFPPMAVALAAQRAAGVLEARLHVAEPTIDAHGALLLAPSPRYRALFLAGLAALRDALDRAFPGLAALVGAADALGDEPEAPGRGGAAAGPYRQRGSADGDEPPPPRPSDLEGHLASQLDRLGLGIRRDRALAHAAMIGSLGRWRRLARARVPALDRLAFWSTSEAEATLAALEARQRWHRGLAHALVEDAVGLVRAATRTVFPVALRDALVRAHALVDRLGTRRGSSSSSMSCPVFHHAESLAAIDALARVIATSWGLRGTRTDLAAAVTAVLRTTPPAPSPAAALTEPRPLAWEQIVRSVAEALRGGPWLAVHAALSTAEAARAEAEREALSAAGQVTTWDAINVFTDSPAEERRDGWAARAGDARAAERTARAQLDTLLDTALAVYPPAAAYFGLEGVRAQVAAVRAVLRRRTHTRRVGKTTTTTTSYQCELLGKAEAVGALRRWTVAATAVFGHLPSDGEILVRAWSRPLRSDAHASPTARLSEGAALSRPPTG